MSNKVVSDSFETLTSAAQSVVNDVAENIGIKPPVQGSSEQGGSQPQQKSDGQIKKMDTKAKSVARKRYNELQSEIKKLQVKRAQEMTKYHKPGNTDEEKQKNEIKQLESSSVPPVGGTTADKGNLPPLPVRQAAHKTEKFRGSSG